MLDTLPPVNFASLQFHPVCYILKVIDAQIITTTPVNATYNIPKLITHGAEDRNQR